MCVIMIQKRCHLLWTKVYLNWTEEKWKLFCGLKFFLENWRPSCLSSELSSQPASLVLGGGALDPQALSILRGVYRLQGIQITSFTGKAGIFEQDNPKHQLLKSMAS